VARYPSTGMLEDEPLHRPSPPAGAGSPRQETVVHMTTSLTATQPEDLLAAAPLVLGFRPEESLVMLTFGAAQGFHARVDLPPPGDTAAVREIVRLLLAPSRSHRVASVAFLVYSGDRRVAAELAAALVPAFVAEGIKVVDVLRAHAGRWCSVPVTADGVETTPRTYDDQHHPFAAQSVVEGRVTHQSREALRETLARDPDRRARWASMMADLAEPEPAELLEALELIQRWVECGVEPDDDGATHVLRMVTRVEVRDAALYAVTRASAADHLRVWSCLLRGASDDQVPDVAALTAFCAWLSGDGALAWCALDRCFAVDDVHRLGRCLAECLERALPPSAWEDAAERHGLPAAHPVRCRPTPSALPSAGERP